MTAFCITMLQKRTTLNEFYITVAYFTGSILEQYKHCNLIAIFLLMYQANASVHKMIVNNKKALTVDYFFARI